MSENTGIRIETVKEVTNNGKKGFGILSITALPKDKLPAMYLDNNEKPIVYLDSDGDLHLKSINEENYWACLNSFYACTEMEKRLAHIREAGQHLTDVNAHLRKEREAWNGKVTFVDGEEIPEVRPRDPQLTPAKDVPIPLAEKIAEMWGSKRLYYRDDKGKYRNF